MNPIKISNLNTDRNINPTWSPNGQQVVFSRFDNQREGKLGHPQHFTLYDVKMNTYKNMDPNLHGNTIMYNPKWSSNGDKLLVQGMIKQGLLGGLILYDINTNENTALKVTKNTSLDEINELYRGFEYSNDEQSIFYFSEDKRSIIKYDIKSKLETSIISGKKTIHFFNLSNDNTRIAFGYWFKDDKNLYTMPITGGAKKKLLTFENCDCSDNLIAWGKDDKYIYFKDGKFRNFDKIMRISVDGGNPEDIFDFKPYNKKGIVTRVNLHPDNSKIAVEFEIGKGEIWKLEGIFNE
jgi:Tol biopolymer transport system component